MIETAAPGPAPAAHRAADAPLGNRLHASSYPANSRVLEVPSHGWEVAF